MIWKERKASEVRVGDTIIRNVRVGREFENDDPYGAFFVKTVKLITSEHRQLDIVYCYSLPAVPIAVIYSNNDAVTVAVAE